ncbi:MAG: hemolysin III family protein [Patescibacteria group bacterium]
MNVFAHREDDCGLFPRHPVVSIIDLIGAGIAIGFLVAQAVSPFVLPIVIAAQYLASCVYHWRPHCRVRQTIDHLMIAVLITATYVQFWMQSLPEGSWRWRVLVLSAVMAVILVVRLLLPDKEKLRGILFLVLGLGGLGMSVAAPDMLSAVGWAGFLAGVALYFLQFVIYSRKKPNPVPGAFGFREVQHLILLAATTLHLVTITQI